MCIRDRYQRRVHGEKKILISNLCYTIDFMDLIVQQLVSQGIDKELAEKAYNQCKSKDLTSIIKWITEYQEKQAIEMSIQDNYGQQNQNVEGNQNLDKKEDNNNNNNKDNSQKMNIEEQKTEQQPVQAEGKPISDMVDQDMVKQLREQGFSKNVAEKSLFLTLNKKTIEGALDWIEEHSYDPDFEEELRIVGEQQIPKQLTPEELEEQKRKMQELIKKKREERKKEEEDYEKEKEKKRIESSKAMSNIRQEIQEAQQKKALFDIKRQREQDQMDKQKILEQLQRDKEERFGKKFDIQGKPADQKKIEKTPLQLFEDGIGSIVLANPDTVFPGKAKLALQTIHVYLENLMKNPQEEKYKKITTSKPYFQQKVDGAVGGRSSLIRAGFIENGEFLEYNQNIDQQFLQQCVKIIENQYKLI
eukprot:TRINITY_DN4155_c0_g2_i4.p2 TRINITY_DN4155_c0_g2~~TRINITY_DN4155_c0_g2_i4.p2  ORF type:complete len:418 (-),score=135.57 TRINITY_DN4155_c0_g2_i4:116-1369(-)